jgi:hypothetical protein
MSERKTILGFGASDLFGGVHTAGKVLLTAFGAGAAVAPLESLEAPILPDWAKSGAPSAVKRPDHVVQHAECVIVVPRAGKPTMVLSPDLVGIYGGRRFEGNGYAGPADIGAKFSFGYDAPSAVEVVAQGKTTKYDAKQVLFCKGVEGTSNIAGEPVMAKKGILTTILGVFGFDDPSDNYTVGAAVANAAGLKTLVPTNKYVQGAVAAAGAHLNPIKTGPAAYGFQFKTTPKGRKFTSLVLNRTGRHDPRKTIRAARAVAQRAQQAGKDTLGRVAKAKNALGKKAVLGAPARRQALSISALEQRAHALITAGQNLAAHVDKYQKVVDNDNAKAHAKAVQAQRVTRIKGDDEITYFQDICGEYFTDIVGDATWDDIVSADLDLALEAQEVLGLGEPVPDPLRPGLLTDGSPDPSYGGGYGPAPPAPTTGDGATGATGVPGPPDYGAGTPPALSGGVVTMPDGTTAPAPGVDYMPDPYPNGDDPTFYDCPTDADLPLGAVVYDGSQSPPFQGLGNYTVFFGTLPGSAPPKGGPNSGYSLHDDGWWLLLQGTQPSVNYSGDRNYDKVANPDSAMQFESKKNNWGPLMGNPNGGWTHGLRFSPSGPNGPRWFWYFDTAARVAPWAVQATLQALLNDAITQYKAAVTAGQTDYVNAQLQDRLNAAAAAQQAQQQAATDAQLYQQSSIANAQDAIAQQQYQQQLQQAQLEAAKQAQQSQLQQSTLEQQAQALQLQFFQEHPEAMFVPADQGGAGGDDGGGYGAPGDALDTGGIDWDGRTSPRDTLDTGGASADELEAEAGDLFPGE